MADDDDEELRRQTDDKPKKKKKKKKPKVEDGGAEEGGGGADGEQAPRKKKKKKKKPVDEEEGGIDTAFADGGDVDDNDRKPAAKKKKKKKKKPPSDQLEGQIEAHSDQQQEQSGYNDGGTAIAAVAAASPAGAYQQDNNDDMEEEKKKREWEDNNAHATYYNGNDGDIEMATKNGGYEEAYCFEADTEIMAEIQQDNTVQVDESGGIQAFVAETIEIDGDDVGIIKSDAEIEAEEKRKYVKWFGAVVCCLVVVVMAIAIPLTLKYTNNVINKTRYVSDPPTEPPSQMPSVMPSGQPTSTRFMEIVEFLMPLSGNALKVQGSPQYKAAMWMESGDMMPNSRGGTGLSIQDAGFTQRYIMALFYYAMDGDNWVQKQGWLSEKSECEWFGVDGFSEGCGSDGMGGCIKRSDFEGDYNKVCRLSMGRLNNLFGEFPKELGQLEEMRYVEIQDDWLIGTIPKELGIGWRKLHTFLIGGNVMYGGIPSSFANNEFLGTVFIDRNNFNGTWPTVFDTLKNLEWLDAEANDFTGTLTPGIGELKSLRIFNANNNSISGKLPDTFDESNLIEDFEVAYNKFSSTLPESLGKAKFLKDLRASGNQISGGIPVSYYKLKNLEELYLDNNRMVGELPQTYEPFYDGLQEFSIHTNMGVKGRFPVENFEKTLRVKVIELHDTELTGQITENICGRLDPSLSYTRLTSITADCDKVKCSCCTCYEDGKIVPTDP
mmetsp:Transcript_10564/g.16057  ORF Transcript_10564/g.16057 Transcript_10564/m.16057 type:complete len:721 (-) Transcript_10564:1143-3305(-)